MTDPVDDSSFDFVVVGAGSAGAIVAARLSEKPDVRVALIEAGGRDEDEVFTRASLWPLQQVTSSDWDYDTEPEPGLNGRRLSLARGKVLGGSSSMNGMIYLRGAHDDYDNWQRSGLAGWGWEDVLPVFRRMEDSSLGESEYHGVGGPIKVTEALDKKEPVASSWLAAAQEVGHPFNPDFNGASHEGVGYFPLNAHEGKRCGSSAAYLAPAASRNNLVIFTYTQALRVILERGRATGVEVEHLGKRFRLRAEQEVILCGGAYNSPQLLMLSGIGHAGHLSSVGVNPVVDLPVGDNLQDHPGTGIYFKSETPGPAEQSSLGEAGGFFRTSPGLDLPDTETMVYPYYQGPLNRYRRGVGGAFSISAQVLRPQSRGTVRLRSHYETAHPVITHNHFTEERDRRVILDALRLNIEITRSESLKRIVKSAYVGPEDDTDEGLLDYLKRTGSGFWHPTSSCSMGAVVDERLRVYGVEGLRVADASVMPTIVGANPNATVFMIGERVADFIAEDNDLV